MILSFISSIFAPVANLVDDLHTSEEEKLRFRNELAAIQKDIQIKAIDLDKQIVKDQTKIQIAELKQESWFVKAARPFATWSLVSIIIFSYVASPFLKYIWDIDVPKIDDTAIITLGAISGTHTLGRTWEKIKGKAK